MFKGRDRITASEEVFELSKVSDDLGTCAREINFYRKRGLIAQMPPGAANFIKAKDIERLKVMLRGRRAGLKTTEIEAMLNSGNYADFKIADKVFNVSRCQQRLRDLYRKRHEISLEIVELERAQQFQKPLLQRIVFPPNAPQPL